MANPVVIGDGLHVHNVTSAEEARVSQASVWAKIGTAGAIGARSGVVWAGSSTLLVGTATVGPPMTVLVKACHFIGVKAAGEGCYQSALAADTLVDVGAAPATNSRIDVVYVMQQDALSTTSPDGLTRGVVEVVAGTSGVSPVAPSIPVGAVEVGQLRVYAGATTTAGGSVTITTTARWTAPVGCPIPVRNSTERDALTVYPGLGVYRIDTATTERYNAARTAWLSSPSDRRSYSANGTSFTFTSSYTDLGGMSLALPAGKWRVTATANTDVSTGTQRIYFVRLWDGTTQQDLLSIMAGLGHRIPFTLQALVTYASPTTIKVQGYTSAVDGTQTVGNGRMTATPIADS